MALTNEQLIPCGYFRGQCCKRSSEGQCQSCLSCSTESSWRKHYSIFLYLHLPLCFSTLVVHYNDLGSFKILMSKLHPRPIKPVSLEVISGFVLFYFELLGWLPGTVRVENHWPIVMATQYKWGLWKQVSFLRCTSWLAVKFWVRKAWSKKGYIPSRNKQTKAQSLGGRLRPGLQIAFYCGRWGTWEHCVGSRL